MITVSLKSTVNEEKPGAGNARFGQVRKCTPHANSVTKSTAVSYIFIYAALCGIYTQTTNMMHVPSFCKKF
jgi:hypothetical protein